MKITKNNFFKKDYYRHKDDIELWNMLIDEVINVLPLKDRPADKQKIVNINIEVEYETE